MSLDQLGIPPIVKEFGHLRSGLVLVTGPTGSGKSTTLAALLDYINTNFRRHIITVEEPIEFVHRNKKSIITQREVPIQTPSFATGLSAALRQDADIVLVGEMRDLETISLAITAAETGHLVLGTLHTGNAARTLDRVLDVFPIDQREQIRIMVSESLRGIVSQQLVPRTDGNGRAMALEVLVNNAAVSNCIREGKTFMLNGVMQTGKNLGMITMDDSLRNLFSSGQISQEECMSRAEDKILMRAFFKGA
jgi:twitching motility protein PilT